MIFKNLVEKKVKELIINQKNLGNLVIYRV